MDVVPGAISEIRALMDGGIGPDTHFKSLRSGWGKVSSFNLYFLCSTQTITWLLNQPNDKWERVDPDFHLYRLEPDIELIFLLRWS